MRDGDRYLTCINVIAKFPSTCHSQLLEPGKWIQLLQIAVTCSPVTSSIEEMSPSRFKQDPSSLK